MSVSPDSTTARVTYPTENEILITREFGVPQHVVYRAWTTPEVVRRWWSGHRGQVTGVEIDLRVGGHWRYVMVADDGSEVAFHGEYREIVPGERIVYTEVFEGRPDTRALTTVTFTEEGGHTVVAIRVRYDSTQDRDAHRNSMDDGLQEALDLLEQAAMSLTSGSSHTAGAAQPGGAP